ncbi:MAG: acid phosphatase [Bacteroidetes bacterium]|nr:acid phosphatase [Bacteroidota bacterium]MBS1932171.1 acid phosphatase [Bacteroidota bacterium]
MKKITLIIVLLCISAFAISQHALLPRPAHIIIVIEENHGLKDIIRSPFAPYINRLSKEGALFTNSHGILHPSQPNYIALFSGSTQGVAGDNCLLKESPLTTSNLGAALIKARYTFTGFAETMPSAGFTGCSFEKSKLTNGALYARKHCPWVNWQGPGENNFPDSIGQTLTEFPKNFNKLPTVAFLIPNQDNDMHNGNGDSTMIKRADDWLKVHIEKYVKWAKNNNSLLIVTFDEDNFTLENHIPTIFVGPMVKRGKYNDLINHYNVLRTIEAMYNLPASGTANETPIKNVWKKK